MFCTSNSGYFDPNNMRTKDQLAEREARGSVLVATSCKQNYDKVVSDESSDQTPLKWYNIIWLRLPFKPLHDIFILGCQRTFLCCKSGSDFKTSSLCNKFFYILSRMIGVVLNLYALYVAIVACGATYQISNTKAKLPYVNEALYQHMNQGPVCAFDQKGGAIKTFSSREEAHLANYQVAHCGPCGHCSNWNGKVSWK